ncbi:DUF6228 family protein [Nocardia pneumoniae]|uniref:DUF6228 family protein n=1 Tax=Nocardia pneumoniae TaxID=228601 RepID=UPI0002E7DB94|nr:DUF6228 family protein [Nocardia pneumoniae]
MTCEFDREMVDHGEAIEMIDRSFGSRVRLWHRTMPYRDGRPCDDDFVAMCAELSAEGMSASMRGLLVDHVGGRSLSRFVDTLEQDFTGWTGIRTWESMDHELRIDTEHAPLGHVRLTWTLMRQSGFSTSWTATTVTVLEAGEQVRQFAATIHRFLRPSESGQLP